MRKKKPPEIWGPRGAKDSFNFPGAIGSMAPSILHRLPGPILPTGEVQKASDLHVTKRFPVRRDTNDECSRAGSLTLSKRFHSSRVIGEKIVLNLSSSHRLSAENMELILEGQGRLIRFLRRFFVTVDTSFLASDKRRPYLQRYQLFLSLNPTPWHHLRLTRQHVSMLPTAMVAFAFYCFWASRIPANCQRESGGKKFRYVLRI